MKHIAGDAIAERAITQIGTNFRLHGRTPRVALDCVGLVAYAIEATNVPNSYSLKGVKLAYILSYMDSIGLQQLSKLSCIHDGDVANAGGVEQQGRIIRHDSIGPNHSM